VSRRLASAADHLRADGHAADRRVDTLIHVGAVAGDDEDLHRRAVVEDEVHRNVLIPLLMTATNWAKARQ
jgi:hypothetical protein